MLRQKRVFKTKTFDRWAKKVIADALLCEAAREIERGLFEADLGQGVCKKRIAVSGRGKSGSSRTLVAKQHKSAIFYIAGRRKSDPGTDFSPREEEAAKVFAGFIQSASSQQLEQLTTDEILKEICNDKKTDTA